MIIPEQRNYELALSEALEIARRQLVSSDIGGLCLQAGVEFRESANGKTIAIKYLVEEHYVSLPDANVINIETKNKLPPRERLLVLHYLLNAKGTPLTGRPITIKEIPDGLNYYPTFVKRALQPLINAFSRQPVRLIAIAGKLGGRQAENGDAAVIIDAFPRVPLTYILWRGDLEFPPGAGIVYDRSITNYLPVEDIIVLSEIISWKLVRLADQEKIPENPE
jgi:hypothetical protein